MFLAVNATHLLLGLYLYCVLVVAPLIVIVIEQGEEVFFTYIKSSMCLID